MNVAKVKDLVDSEMVNEIVDEIISELKSADKSGQKSVQTTIPQSELVKLRVQLENLQNAFEVDEVEIERQVTENFEKLSDQLESKVAGLEQQINDLRTALIRLSGEIRKLKEEKGPGA